MGGYLILSASTCTAVSLVVPKVAFPKGPERSFRVKGAERDWGATPRPKEEMLPAAQPASEAVAASQVD